MVMLNRWVVNIGSGILSGIAWILAKNDNFILFIIIMISIIIWNYLEGLFKKPNKFNEWFARRKE